MRKKKTPALEINPKDYFSQTKDSSRATIHTVDTIAEDEGYVSRPVHRRRKLPNPRTRQVHAKVMPHIYEEILLESKRRGVQQGVLIEEMWNTRVKQPIYWQISEKAKARGVSPEALIEEACQTYLSNQSSG